MDGGDQICFTVTEHFVLVRKCHMADMMLNYSLFCAASMFIMLHHGCIGWITMI